MSKRPCSGKCADFNNESKEQCNHCLIPEKSSCPKIQDNCSISEIPNNSDFVVGDVVVAIAGSCNELFEIESKGKNGGLYDTKWRKLHIESFRHATPAEIKAGHRIEIQSLGDDEHIDNHVSPLCVRGGNDE